MEAYLDALDRFSDEQVRVACKSIIGKCGAFVPSASELAEECRNATVYKVDPVKLARFRGESLDPPKPKLTEEERAANRARVEKMIKEWKAQAPVTDRRAGDDWKPAWKPGPLGSLIAADLMALMPKEPLPAPHAMQEPPPAQSEEAPQVVLQEMVGGTEAFVIEDDAPLF